MNDASFLTHDDGFISLSDYASSSHLNSRLLVKDEELGEAESSHPCHTAALDLNTRLRLNFGVFLICLPFSLALHLKN